MFTPLRELRGSRYSDRSAVPWHCDCYLLNRFVTKLRFQQSYLHIHNNQRDYSKEQNNDYEPSQFCVHDFISWRKNSFHFYTGRRPSILSLSLPANVYFIYFPTLFVQGSPSTMLRVSPSTMLRAGRRRPYWLP